LTGGFKTGNWIFKRNRKKMRGKEQEKERFHGCRTLTFEDPAI